jgi:hypothetical protein
MLFKLLSIAGLLVAVACFWVATMLHPGGYDWSRDYITTLLRDPSSTARFTAIAGLLCFCVSLALIFGRLARVVEFTKCSSLIKIGGIGSSVYAALAFTRMHDLMVTISLIFFLVAVAGLLRALYLNREMGFFASGIVCLAVLLGGATLYYTGHPGSALAWGQRVSHVLFAVWLVTADWSFPRPRVQDREKA